MAGRMVGRSGRRLVYAMLAFGVVMTLSLYVFAMWQRGPFRELNVALAKEFPEAAPRVEGGLTRFSQPGRRVLRVTMKYPAEAVGDRRKEDAAFEDVSQFMQTRPEIRTFDLLEVHLFDLPPEGEMTRDSREFRIEEGRIVGLPESK